MTQPAACSSASSWQQCRAAESGVGTSVVACCCLAQAPSSCSSRLSILVQFHNFLHSVWSHWLPQLSSLLLHPPASPTVLVLLDHLSVNRSHCQLMSSLSKIETMGIPHRNWQQQACEPAACMPAAGWSWYGMSVVLVAHAEHARTCACKVATDIFMGKSSL